MSAPPLRSLPDRLRQIALFELGHPHESPIPLRVGMTVLLLVSVAFYRWFLDASDSPDEREPEADAL